MIENGDGNIPFPEPELDQWSVVLVISIGTLRRSNFENNAVMSGYLRP